MANKTRNQKSNEGLNIGVTSYDVARRVGVSQSAVSRAFRSGASIAPATRARIVEAANALGYEPNAIAQGLITKRSNLVAIIISNLTNLYYPEVLAELTQRLSRHGVRVLLFSLAAESDVDEVLGHVWRYRVDGAIVAARLSADQLTSFSNRGVPVVLYNRIGEALPVASVCCDSEMGERALVDGLVTAGHRHFGLIAGPADSYVGEERTNAATRRLAKHDLSPIIVRGQFDYDSGGAGLRSLMEATQGRLDALICVNDLMAIGAIDCAKTAFELKVPGDLSIVGFDGVSPATWQAYQLTTVRQPVGRMTEAAVAMLIERIEFPDTSPEQRLYAGELLAGRSARLL
jgi:DNA-binding LacI/PurR family transcriptional regulator